MSDDSVVLHIVGSRFMARRIAAHGMLAVTPTDYREVHGRTIRGLVIDPAIEADEAMRAMWRALLPRLLPDALITISARLAAALFQR